MTARLIELDRQFGDEGELGRVFLENRRTKNVGERVVPYELRFLMGGEPDFVVGRDSQIKRLEERGMKTMYELAKTGYSHVFWLSPSGGPGNYNEGRLVVANVTEREEEVRMDCRGIPIVGSSEEMWEMAQKLLNKGGVIMTNGLTDVENLREQAIGINIKNDQLWDFCQSVFGMDDVWHSIKKGEDIKRTDEVVGVVGMVLDDINMRFGKISQNNSIEAGIIFERMMAERGWNIVGGNHGATNMSFAVGQMNSFDKLYSVGENSLVKIDSSGELRRFCKVCRIWYTGDKCPVCG